jgi:hypothetical protein
VVGGGFLVAGTDATNDIYWPVESYPPDQASWRVTIANYGVASSGATVTAYAICLTIP